MGSLGPEQEGSAAQYNIMSFSKTNQIREIVKRSRSEAAQLEQLRQLIRESVPRLHGAIQLPPNNADTALADFVFRYIEHVPNFIDALGGLTKEAGIHDYASVFLTIAEDFFLEPPDVIAAAHGGLNALLAEAYLAHRLIEEINDRVIARCGIPLAPMDMTRANLIVHQLLGENLANDLDFVVHYSIELHMDKEKLMENKAFHLYVREHKLHGWITELDRWPGLAEDLSIDVSFREDGGFAGNQEVPKAIH